MEKNVTYEADFSP